MISVAMATYNGEKYIKKQLESIRLQKLPADEVIICDDLSSDNTVEICRDFIKQYSLDNWHVFVNESNVGFCLNFYGAVSRCSGDIIFLSDQDDEWLPEKISVMANCIESHPEISVLSSRYDVIDGESNPIDNSNVKYLGNRFDGSLDYVTLESLIGCSYIRGFSICFKREISALIKPIDLKSLLAHDWLICALGCIKSNTAILNTVLTHYRYHGDNVSLAAMDPKKRSRNINKRINGLRESVDGHSYILSLCSGRDADDISKFIRFEKRRLLFLTDKSLWIFLGLAFNIRQYNRYYKGNGIRVYFGDFVYAYKNK